MSQERVSSMDEKKIRAGRQERYTEDQQSCSPDQKQHEIDQQYQEDPVREQKTEDTLREMAEDVEIPQSITPEAVEKSGSGNSAGVSSGRPDGSIWRQQPASAWPSASRWAIRRSTKTGRHMTARRREMNP